MAIWTNWDPLKTVVVGDCYTQSPNAKLSTIFQETKEDLDALANYLTKLGVEVFRPKVTEYADDIDLANFKVQHATAPIVPRDQYLAYGNTIYQTYTSMPDRYLDSVNYYHIFQDMYDRGYNWISQPPPVLDTLVDKWWANGQQVYGQQLHDRILWHTATMFKCGDKLITNTRGPGTLRGLDWMSRNLPANCIVPADNYQQGFGHIDHGWFMVRDDLIFCVNKSWVPSILHDRELVELQAYFDMFDDQKYIADYQSTDGKYSDAWLDKWLGEWKGYAQEVFFDSNVLVVDSNNIIFSNKQPRIFKVLEKYGINCHVAPQRHGLFWEAGIHCLTLDLVRDGECRSVAG
jgi:glycine amidinotransferase